MRISDWSSEVCSSDLIVKPPHHVAGVNVVQREGLRSILGTRLRTPANSARREWLGKSGIVGDAASLSSLIAKPGMARLPALTSFWPWSRNHTFTDSGQLESLRIGKERVSTCRKRWE